MKVQFIHPNFPAQFGHLALYLTQKHGWDCTCVTSIDTTHLQMPFKHVNYKLNDGPQPKTFFNPDSLNVLIDHAHAVYKGLRTAPQLTPDLVVGHMSYGTMLYLRVLYPEAKFVGYYEIVPERFWTDEMNLRKDYPCPEPIRLFNGIYHALTYLHLLACDGGYTPTHFQLGTCPKELQHKLRVIHDGIDCDLFSGNKLDRPHQFHDVLIPPEAKVVTYCSRGLESSRGFDIFMKAAKIVGQVVPEALFLIAGSDRVNYGHEQTHIGKRTFKEWVLAQDDYDLSRFRFLGVIQKDHLATLYSLSDLHVYLTVPYVLSWSMLEAMAAGCVLIGSDTAPVREVIQDGKNGLLTDFYDHEALAKKMIRVLKEPEQYRRLGLAARNTVLEKYEWSKCAEQLKSYFEEFVK